MGGGGVGERPAVDLDGAGIGRDDAGHDLHEARLAGAVAAEKRMHFPGLQGERNTLQHRNGAVGLPDVRQLRDPPGRRATRHSAPVHM